MGWSPADNKEVKNIDELIDSFSLERISPSPAIFEFDKLNWMNGYYIRNLPISEITDRVLPYLSHYDISIYTREQLETMIVAVREPLTILSEITNAVSYFFGDSIEIDAEIQKNVINIPESQRVLVEFFKITEGLNYINTEELHNQLADFRKSISDLKPKQIMWAIRAALTGRTKGADIVIVISLLGKERVKSRVKDAIR